MDGEAIREALWSVGLLGLFAIAVIAGMEHCIGSIQ